MNIRFLLIVVLCMMPKLGLAQTNSDLIRNADDAFYSGNYSQAYNFYTILWAEYDDEDSKKRMEICNECISYLNAGTKAERDGDFPTAINNYKKVLALNPRDKSVQGYIENCKNKIYTPYLDEAKRLYREGHYSQSRAKLSEYTSLSGHNDPELSANINKCEKWANEAQVAFSNRNYDTAKSYYDKIIALNPTDAVSAKKLADVNRLNQKTQTVYVKEPTPTVKEPASTSSLRPPKNRFNLFVYSGFERPTSIGCGLGFNLSYFNLGFDVGYGSVPISDDRILEEDIEKFVIIDNHTLTQGSLQFAITPGLNLKYFSIGVGLGTMMTKVCSVRDINTYSVSVNVTDDSLFLIRPTINALIPFNSNYSSGLLLMAGYNIVSGMSELNQFICGLGFFF